MIRKIGKVELSHCRVFLTDKIVKTGLQGNHELVQYCS